MTETLTSVTGDSGIWGVGRLITTQLRWHFRPQPVADVGIDVLVEPVLGGRESGRLLALQVKAGGSWFDEPTSDGNGWIFREKNQIHRDYWLNFKVPVLVVLYNVEKDVAYWQQITPATAIVTGKGFKVEIPSSQRIDATAHDVLARLAREVPPDGLTELLDKLPSSCANRLRLWDEINPVGARGLAAELVAGRDNPAGTVRTITAGWTDGHPWPAWMAVGEYAHEYELTAIAAQLFLAAAQAGGDEAPSARLRAFAGLMLSNNDPHRARTLLEECLVLPETHLLAVVGLATLDHGAGIGPIPIPADIEADPDGAAREPTVQWFLAQQRQLRGDRDGAVQHHQQALAHAPGSTKQTLALAEALLRRAGTGAISGTADYRDAASHAEAARADFRRWRGNSVRAAHVLMQARIMVADVASAFLVAQAQPDGEATPEEAASPLLAFTAARIAYGLGDLARGEEFGAVIEASGDRVWLSHLMAIRADALGADAHQREQAWRAVLAVDDDVSRRVVVCAHLAAMGCWPVAELDETSAAGLLTPGTYETQHARALAATGDPDNALAVLRGFRHDSLIAAEAYIQLLDHMDRVEDCVHACQEASIRLGAAHLEMYALDVLARAGMDDQFILQATDLLGRTDLPYRLRHHIRARLIDEHAKRQAWNTCEQLANRGLLEISQHQADVRAGRHDALMVPSAATADLADLRRKYAWMLIVQQLNQGQADRAFDTLSTLTPDVESPVEAAAWCELHQIHGWTLHTANLALDLTQQLDQPPDLIGEILSNLVHSVPISDDPASVDFHERLSSAWRSYIQKHQPPSVSSIDATPEQTLAQVPTVLKTKAGQHQSLSEDIRNGVLPVGAASTATGRPYLLDLAQGAAGLLPAVASTDEANRLEAQAAAEALDKPVVIETTALYMAASMLGHWHAIQAHFSDLLLAAPTARDIRLSHAMARRLTNASGALIIDPSTGHPLFSGFPDDTRTATIDRCAAVHQAAQTCRVVPIDNLDILWSNHPMHHGGAWLAPIAVALERQLPLYSDDIVLRGTARARGVPAFGTLTLLDALITAGRSAPAPDDTALATLFNHQVVDLVHAADLLLNALDEQGPLAAPVLLNLARPALWRRHPDKTVPMLLTFMSKVPAGDTRGLAGFVSACAAGWAAAFTPPGTVIATLAALVLAFHTGVNRNAARIVLPAIQGVADQHDADPIPHIHTLLVGILTDPSGEFHLTKPQANEHVEVALQDFI